MTQIEKNKIIDNSNNSSENPAESISSGCGCSTTSSCCGGSADTEVSNTPKSSCCGGSPLDSKEDNVTEHTNITIDGQKIEVTPDDKNIVDVASRMKIRIPAPCYRNKKKKGCCNACVVDIDGEQKFACSTVPKNGMNIVIDREDLKAIRKERLQKYKEGIKTGIPCGCSELTSNSCCS